MDKIFSLKQVSKIITYEVQECQNKQWQPSIFEVLNIDIALDIKESLKTDHPDMDFRIVKRTVITELIPWYHRKGQ